MPTIIPGPDTDVPALARKLLDAADHPSEVATDTSGNTTAFVISDELAEKLGYGTVDVEEPEDGDGHVDVNGSTESVEPGNVHEDNETVEEPKRGGAGSGGEVWYAFLEDQGVEIPDDVTADDRTELIALWDAHKAAQG
ncbi:hypothetical protein [Rhodococcoides kyotonense]|uniref:Uncharacterized protein n=1 Tax=Rhodococcoides kyotonense TaxID=398843 RepID=A0A239FP11_9NOCA|nr:hypothetical protein [Rhodococcus kyotonensis]SNS58607.1 hypothetical protein SAMN05421642_103391 [Rhodococcus kyotonensis]